MLLLLAAALCYDFNSNVIEITDNNFGKIIDSRPNNSVFIVMFSGDHCPACQQAYPYFQEAADDSQGLISFGHVDANSQYKLSSRFQIRGIPTFKIFHPNGVAEYEGNRQPRSFINSAAKYIVDLSEPITESWLPSDHSKAAILFSAKPQTPPLWAAISGNFSGTDINIGFTNSEDLRKKFEVAKVPSIIFVHPDGIKKYEGKQSFNDLQSAIENEFIPKKAHHQSAPRKSESKKVAAPEISVLDSKEKFEAKCKNLTKFCVIEASDKPSNEFLSIAAKYVHDPFTFAICGAGCPISGMSGSSWIFHTKRDVAIKADNFGDLALDIDRIIGGNPKWDKVSNLLQSKEL